MTTQFVRRTATAIAPISFALALGALASTALAQSQPPTPEQTSVSAEAEASGEEGSAFSVKRIELSLWGGRQSGTSYLELPAPLYPDRTFDTGRNDIIGFGNGVNLRGIVAPQKGYDDGLNIGGGATFYLSEQFGLQLFGQIATTQAFISGYRTTPEGEPAQTEADRFEWDRSDLTQISLGGNILYHVGKERKRRGGRKRIRPYINLGFGGILNRFASAKDMNATYFLYGAGLSAWVAENLRLQAGANFQLFTWETPETSLDESVTIPSFGLQLIWKYDVPFLSASETDGETLSPAADVTGR